MADWVIGLLIAGGVALAAAMVHGVVTYRRLIRKEAAEGREITSLSLAVWRQARKIVILLIGGSVVLVGILLFFTPGPAMVVIPLGLAILAIEFAWARRWLRQLRATLHLSAKRTRRWFRGGAAKTSVDG